MSPKMRDMARYLITQSLLSAWAYTFSCCDDQQENARSEFLAALHREPLRPTPAMVNGTEFEQECYKAAAGVKRPPYTRWEAGIQAVAKIIKGAPVQIKASRELECCGMTFLVFGVLDALKEGTIFDVKFLNKSMKDVDLAGKYLTSPQHPTYFYIVPEAREFKYLVSDGEEVYIETYQRYETPHIKSYVEDFMHSLETDGLLDVYKANWMKKC